MHQSEVVFENIILINKIFILVLNLYDFFINCSYFKTKIIITIHASHFIPNIWLKDNENQLKRSKDLDKIKGIF